MGGTNTGWRLAGLALAWLAGVALQLHERALLAPHAYFIALGAGTAMLAVGWRWRRVWMLALLGAVALGFGASGWRASQRGSDALPPALEGQDVQVTGVIASLPQRSAAGLRFRFEVEQATLNGRAVALPWLLSLGWYKGFHEDAALSQPQQSLGAGQRWRFTVRLRQPHGNVNPHGFDVELTLFEQGIRATGYVRDAPVELIDRSAGYVVERWRQHVRDAVDATVSDRRAAGVLAALAVGDQSAIERDDWDVFRNTGVAHLVSISGLHITMFAWLAGLLIAASWRRSRRAMLFLPAQQAARWGGVGAAAAYAVFSGWGVPSQRTVWMLIAITLLQTWGRRWPWPLILLFAAVVVTAVDPWALLQPGFWLSFVAVALLMSSDVVHRSHEALPAVASGWRARAAGVRHHLRGELRSQVIATLGLTPLSLVFFQQVSVVGFLANLFAIPLITLVITPLALLGSFAAPLWWLAAWSVQQLCTALAWLASVPGAVWVVPVAPAWAQAAALVAGALLVMPLPWRLRALAVPLALPLLWPPIAVPDEGRFELLAVDVGQGTAVLVRTHGHLLVYDAGPQYSPVSDAGQRVLLPLLRSRGETRINRLVLSHRDADHVGGAKALLQGLPVGDLFSSLENTHPLLALAPKQERCVGGQSWLWDGVRFEMLQPPADAYDRGLKTNAMSCVLRVSSARSGSALLTGDIEHAQEEALVAALGNALASDVLVAPHHGSKTSSTPAFLDAVAPKQAVFQAGYRNRFGHPAPEVVARYRERQIAVFDSPTCGAWGWRGVDAGPGLCWRDLDQRYWRHPAVRSP